MKAIKASRVNLLIDQANVKSAIAVLQGFGLLLASVQAYRSIRMGKPGLLHLPFSAPPLEEGPAELIRAWVPPSSEQALMAALCDATGVGKPGGGSIFSESVKLFHYGMEALPTPRKAAAEGTARRFDPLSGVICIVQRGQGNQVARLVLDMGLSAPMVGFGTGMGLRNKLGLLRVTIPSGKELVLFLCAPQDSAEAIAFIKDALGISEAPGKAFIYGFPVGRGIADTLISRSESRRHVASMEQVISAIDELSGSSAWRRRSAVALPGLAGFRPRFKKPDVRMACLTLSCLEGQAEEHVQVAMDLGAGGATLSRSLFLDCSSEEGQPKRELRESSDLVLPEDLVAPILDALAFTGFFSADSGGIADISRVELSAAYGA